MARRNGNKTENCEMQNVDLSNSGTTDAEDSRIKITTTQATRKVIDGLLYDTTNAEKILYEDGATYYATQNRRFFCEMCGDITAISLDDMKKIVSTIGNVVYEKYIGKVEKK